MTNTESKYVVRGYTSQDVDGYCDDEQSADTLKEAKRIAKYWLTDEYLDVIESSTPVVRALVFRVAGNECLEDFSRGSSALDSLREVR